MIINDIYVAKIKLLDIYLFVFNCLTYNYRGLILIK
jgi:hypothetical protein